MGRSKAFVVKSKYLNMLNYYWYSLVVNLWYQKI